MAHSNRHLFIKALSIGIVVALLVYWFHPGVGQVSLIVNGEPVSAPWAGLAALPAMLLVLVLIIVLGLLLLFGFGLMIFYVVALFAFLAVVWVAPYFWPVLLVLLLVIVLMSIGSEDARR